MSTSKLDYLRSEYPKRDDEYIAEEWGIRHNLVAIVRYKTDPNESYDCFGCCLHEDQIEQYLESHHCFDAQLFWDGRTEENRHRRSAAQALHEEVDRFKDAAYRGNIKVLKEHLDRGYSPTKLSKGFPVLNSAIYGAQYDSLELLLQYPCDLEQEDINYHTVLMTAVRYDNLQAVQLLLEAGSDVTHRSEIGFTALHYTADTIKWNNERKNSDPRIAMLLIESGADVDAISVAGITPLSWAIEKSQPELELLLRKAGAALDRTQSVSSRLVEGANDKEGYSIPTPEIAARKRWYQFWKG